jgi:hypothetical protein
MRCPVRNKAVAGLNMNVKARNNHTPVLWGSHSETVRAASHKFSQISSAACMRRGSGYMVKEFA